MELSDFESSGSLGALAGGLGKADAQAVALLATKTWFDPYPQFLPSFDGNLCLSIFICLCLPNLGFFLTYIYLSHF